MNTRQVTWKQAARWGWLNRTATIRFLNRRTRRTGIIGDRLGAGVKNLFGAYARHGRVDDVEIVRITRHGPGGVVYEIGHPPTPHCARCGRETWNRHPISNICRNRCRSERKAR